MGTLLLFTQFNVNKFQNLTSFTLYYLYQIQLTTVGNDNSWYYVCSLLNVSAYLFQTSTFI